jgi:hypothetical protein
MWQDSLEAVPCPSSAPDLAISPRVTWRSLRAALVTTLLGVAGALSVAPARASTLAEPPRLCTFKLDDPASPSLPLLEAFHEKTVERPSLTRVYLGGPWARWRRTPWWSLTWQPAPLGRDEPPGLIAEAAPTGETLALAPFVATLAARGELRPPDFAPNWLDHVLPDAATPPFASTGPSLASDGFGALWAPPPKPVPWWKCRRKPVTFVRWGNESDRFELLRCDGSAAPEALDRLTLIARPNGVARPSELLPDDPDRETWERGEWLPQIRVVHPRLVWVLQRIADAFPRRSIYVYSGYRPAPADDRPGSHQSRHASGRALDIHVMGVDNAELFKVCRKLYDVGCGYYPNSKFVHVDVRPGTGHPHWIDASGPGEPAQHVDSWPGVVEGGALSWDARAQADAGAGAAR